MVPTAADLYDAIDETIAAHVAVDGSTISAFEVIGVLEQIKHDLLSAGDYADDGEETLEDDDEGFDPADELAA